MKKSLLALAVLGAFAGAASAQTNVTVYGLVDAAIEYQKSDTVAKKWSLTDGNSSANKNGSRLGFKGTEDLGGGLSALFVIENGFNVDNGQSRTDGLFSRQAFVGLQSGVGTVKFGRQYTPIHLAQDSIDPFGTGMAGNIGNVFNNGGVRMNNTINYSLPKLGGVYGEIAYGFGEVAGNNAASRQIGLSAGYANGPVNVVLAYHTANNATDTAKSRTTMLGGTYDLGVAKAHAAVASNKADARAGSIELGFIATPTQAQTDAAAAAAFDETIKTRDYMLGVSAPVGVGEVRASWARKDDRDSSSHYDQLALGYVHNLSKRTNLYTSYAHGKNKVEGEADLKKNVFNVGLQHKF